MKPVTTGSSWLSGISLEVRCLCVISFISAVGFGIQSPAIPVFGQSLGVGSSMVGLIIAAFPMARLLMAWPSGALSNLWGEYRLLCAGLLIMALTSIAAGFSQSAEQLLLFRGLCGVGSVLYSVSAMSLLLRTTAQEQRGKATGLFMGAYYIGTVAGPAIGSLFVDLSVRLPFFIYGTGAGLAGLVALVLLRDQRHPHSAKRELSQPPTRLRAALKLRAYRAALTSNFAIGFAVYGVRVSVLPLFLLVVLQQPSKWIGIGLTIGALAQTLVLPKAGQYVDKWGVKKPLLLGLSLVLASFLIIQFGHALPAYLLGMACMGLGTAFCTTSAAVAAGDAANGRGGTVISTYQMSADFGMVAGPILIGLLAEHYSYDLALAATTTLLLLAVLTALAIPKTTNKAKPHNAME
ncbi:MFS transporter [Pseudomonas sp. 5P_3.1_Bac2]|uniref:MFS transporter n=1 Tax=Pseudomonas sp. 5P_3.1_Bac2 TaxID=2971617 RepID=UPI0021CA8E44|nr:MFS transporter [Pseudomonas sp. 5P_3.1_Bac2]MCU1717676.1 MFS transporter [Pseudomonas sp. 5P_3.1_Bac2]